MKFRIITLVLIGAQLTILQAAQSLKEAAIPTTAPISRVA